MEGMAPPGAQDPRGYYKEQHRASLVKLKTEARSRASKPPWMLGYPDGEIACLRYGQRSLSALRDRALGEALGQYLYRSAACYHLRVKAFLARGSSVQDLCEQIYWDGSEQKVRLARMLFSRDLILYTMHHLDRLWLWPTPADRYGFRASLTNAARTHAHQTPQGECPEEMHPTDVLSVYMKVYEQFRVCGVQPRQTRQDK